MGREIALLQRSLAGGIVTDALVARGDTAKNASGVADMRNFYVTRAGGAESRAGTEYLAPTASNVASERGFRFRPTATEEFTVVLSPGLLRIFKSDGEPETFDTDFTVALYSALVLLPSVVSAGQVTSLTSGAQAYMLLANQVGASLPNPSTAGQDEQHWRPLTQFSGSEYYIEWETPYSADDLAEVMAKDAGGVMRFTHPNHPAFSLTRRVATDGSFNLGPSYWVFLPTEFGMSATAPSGLTSSALAPGSGKWVRYKVTAVLDETELESLTAPTAATVTSASVANAASTTLDIEITTTPDHELTTGDEVAITAIAATVAGEVNENARRALVGKNFIVTVTGAKVFTLDNTAGLIQKPAQAATMPAFSITYAPTQLIFEVSTLPNKAGGAQPNMMWTKPALGKVKEYYVYRALGLDGTFGFLRATTKTEYTDGEDNDRLDADLESPPPTWQPTFRYGRWPRAVGYHRQRVVYAGSNDEPTRAWLTSLDDNDAFVKHTPLLATDMVSFRIEGDGATEIVAISDIGELLLFTDAGVWTARGDQDGVLRPDTINLQPVTYDGAARGSVATMYDTIVYVERQNSIPREIRFDVGQGGYNGFASRDLTVFAPGLFDGYSIVEWAFVRAPNSLLFALRSDGALLCLTYLRDQDIWAWSRHDTGGDAVQSIWAMPEDGYDALWMIVARTVNSTVVRYIERVQERVGTLSVSADDWWYLDSALRFTSQTTTVSGLDHLEGRVVTALADGEEYTRTVTSGAITLPEASDDVLVGLPITARIETMDPDIIGSTDAVLGKRKRAKGATVFVQATSGLMAGAEGGTLLDPPVDPEQAADLLLTEKLRWRFLPEWTDEGRFVLQTTAPRPASVRAFITHLEIGGD